MARQVRHLASRIRGLPGEAFLALQRATRRVSVKGSSGFGWIPAAISHGRRFDDNLIPIKSQNPPALEYTSRFARSPSGLPHTFVKCGHFLRGLRYADVKSKSSTAIGVEGSALRGFRFTSAPNLHSSNGDHLFSRRGNLNWRMNKTCISAVYILASKIVPERYSIESFVVVSFSPSSTSQAKRLEYKTGLRAP